MAEVSPSHIQDQPLSRSLGTRASDSAAKRPTNAYPKVPNESSHRSIFEMDWKKATAEDNVEYANDMLRVKGAADYQFVLDDRLCGYTPLLVAAELGSLRIAELILGLGVNIAEQTTASSSVSPGENALHVAAKNGHLDMVRMFLNRTGQLLDSKGDDGRSVLMYAVSYGNQETLDYLLARNPNLEAKDANGDSALIHATRSGRLEMVQRLLQRNADKDARNNEGKTAIFFAVDKNYVLIIKALLDRGADIGLVGCDGQTVFHGIQDEGMLCEMLRTPMKHHNTDARAVITTRDFRGDTPLHCAAKRGDTGIVFQLLQTQAYFPQLPTVDRVFLSDPDERENVAKLLSNWMQNSDMGDHSGRYGKVVGYWAILNGEDTHMLAKLAYKVPLDRNGASWAHVAALGGHKHIAQMFLGNGLNVTAADIQLVTPLHIAVRQGHLELVKFLIDVLSRSSGYQGSFSDALMMKGRDGETPLSLAPLGDMRNHREIEHVIWDRLENEIRQIRGFFHDGRYKGAELLEEVTSFSSSEHEQCLHRLFQMKLAQEAQSLGPLFPPCAMGLEPNKNALHWAVYCRCSMVVQSLLSKGGYLNDRDITRAMKINKDLPRDKETETIAHILYDLPDVVIQSRVIGNTRHAPSFEFEPDSDTTTDERVGSIVDLGFYRHRVDYRRKRRSLYEIIYKYGPQKIMMDKDRSHYVLPLAKHQRKRMEMAARNPTSLIESPIVTRLLGPNLIEGRLNKHRQHDLRIIHIPVNDVRLIEDLTVSIARDSNLSNENYRPLARFVRESWAELPAGGRKALMKPQCVWETKHCGSDSRSTCGRKAIFFPYLSFTKRRHGQKNEKPTRQPTCTQCNGMTTDSVDPHDAITLDQYYYVFQEDTEKRDQDQVLSRYPVNWAKAQVKERERTTGSSTPWTKKSAKETPTSPSDQILAIHQAWLFVVDDKTIVLSNTEQANDTDSGLLQHVLNGIIVQKTDDPATIVDLIVKLVLSTAADFFRKKEIPIIGSLMSPQEVFRDSIRIARDEEAGLFDDFLSSAGNTTDATRNDHGNLSEELHLLRQIKDINDELNTLKLLAEDQERVWGQTFKLGNEPKPGDGMPTSAKAEIVAMIHEASQAQEAVNKLLDLKQKQASLAEANSAGQRAREAAKQTRTMQFMTAGTIISIPALFLAALFALPLDIFRREGGEIVLKASTVIRIIVVTTVVTLVIVCALVFQVHGIVSALIFQRYGLGAYVALAWDRLVAWAKRPAALENTKHPRKSEGQATPAMDAEVV